METLYPDDLLYFLFDNTINHDIYIKHILYITKINKSFSRSRHNYTNSDIKI